MSLVYPDPAAADRWRHAAQTPPYRGGARGICGVLLPLLPVSARRAAVLMRRGRRGIYSHTEGELQWLLL